MRKLILSGEQVALAEMIEADQPLFQKWLSENSELRDQIGDQSVPSIEDQMKWFKRVQEPDRKFFSLVTIPDQVLIGNCGFVDIDSGKSMATLRITIGDNDYLGKGLGSEAIRLLVQYAFEKAGWKRLQLKVLADNGRAIRTYEKAGFEPKSVDLQNGKMIITMELEWYAGSPGHDVPAAESNTES